MRRALIAGTFDPPTLGHLDLFERAASFCDHLIIAIAINPHKTPFFAAKEREKMVKTLTKNLSAEVLLFDGLLSQLAKEKKVSFFLRGLRNGSDYDREMQMAKANRQLSKIETIFLPAEGKYSHISSTLIREIAHFGGSLKDLVPPSIEPFFRKKRM